MTRDTPRPDMAQIPERNSGPFAHPPRPTQRGPNMWLAPILIGGLLFWLLVALGLASFAEASWTEYNRAVICAKEGC